MENLNFWQDKRILITGATGFLGSWLAADLVKRDAFVVALVRDRVKTSELFFKKTGIYNNMAQVQGSLEDYSTLERIINEYEIEVVFHLGAQTIATIATANPLPTFKSNVMGTCNLLEACRRNGGVRAIVVASTDKVYGESGGKPYTEDRELRGEFPYDVSKVCADYITRCYYATYGLPTIITRNANLYGGGDINWNRIIPGTIRSIIRNKQPIIRSSGCLVRDYYYADEAVDSTRLLAEKLISDSSLAGQAFNFASGQTFSGIEVVNLILELMNSKLKPVILGKDHAEITHQVLDANKAKNILGWNPKWTLRDGLVPTIKWYKDFLS